MTAPYQLLPDLTEAELRSLAESITEHGVLVPVVIDEEGAVIDGHHRQKIADSLGIAQVTSADIMAYDGNENTFALYDTQETASPMAEAVFDLWRYGQSAYVPSVAEMRLLYTMRKIINPVIEQCGGEPLPLDENDCWYWTSTEVEKQQTAKAWLYSMGSGAMQETPKVQAHKVRPIITINE